MKISIDGGIVTMQPDSVDWTPPDLQGVDGLGAPVLMPYWRVTLGFSRLTNVAYQTWFATYDGALHTITLPHPSTGVLTSYMCYVNAITPRINSTDPNCAAVGGVDIELSRILVVL